MKNRAFFGQQLVFKIETPDKQNLLKNIFFSNLSNAAAAAAADADADYNRADQSPSSENDYSRCSTFLF